MKLVNSLLILLFASYTFGITTEEKERLNEGCLLELEPYNSCEFHFINVSDSEIAQSCEYYKNNACYEFFRDPYIYAPTCLRAELYYTYSLLEYLSFKIYLYKMMCEKNFEGQPCEINKIYTEEIGMDQLDEITLVNCRTPRCTEAYLNLLKSSVVYADKENTNELEVVEEKINFLFSEECQSQIIVNTTTTSKIEKTTLVTTSTNSNIEEITSTLIDVFTLVSVGTTTTTTIKNTPSTATNNFTHVNEVTSTTSNVEETTSTLTNVFTLVNDEKATSTMTNVEESPSTTTSAKKVTFTHGHGKKTRSTTTIKSKISSTTTTKKGFFNHF